MKRTTPSKYRPMGAGFVISAKKTDEEDRSASANPVRLGIATPGRSKADSGLTTGVARPPKPPRTFEYDKQEHSDNSGINDEEGGVKVDVKSLGKVFEAEESGTPKFGRVRKRIPTGEDEDDLPVASLPHHPKSPCKLSRRTGVQFMRGTLVRQAKQRYHSDNKDITVQEEDSFSESESDSLASDTPSKSTFSRVKKEDDKISTPKGQASRVVKDIISTPGRYNRLKTNTDKGTPGNYGRVERTIDGEETRCGKKSAYENVVLKSHDAKSPACKRSRFEKVDGEIKESDRRRSEAVERRNLAASAFEKFRSIDQTNGTPSLSGNVKVKASDKAEIVVSPAVSDSEEATDKTQSFNSFVTKDAKFTDKTTTKASIPSPKLARLSKLREEARAATKDQFTEKEEHQAEATSVHSSDDCPSVLVVDGDEKKERKPRRISLSTECGQMTITVSPRTLEKHAKDKTPKALSNLIDESDKMSVDERADDRKGISLSLDKDNMVTLSPANPDQSATKEVITKISPNVFDEQKISPSSLGQVKRKASTDDVSTSPTTRGTPTRRRERTKAEEKELYDDEKLAALKAKYGRRRNKAEDTTNTTSVASPPPRRRAARTRGEEAAPPGRESAARRREARLASEPEESTTPVRRRGLRTGAEDTSASLEVRCSQTGSRSVTVKATEAAEVVSVKPPDAKDEVEVVTKSPDTDNVSMKSSPEPAESITRLRRRDLIPGAEDKSGDKSTDLVKHGRRIGSRGITVNITESDQVFDEKSLDTGEVSMKSPEAQEMPDNDFSKSRNERISLRTNESASRFASTKSPVTIQVNDVSVDDMDVSKGSSEQQSNDEGDISINSSSSRDKRDKDDVDMSKEDEKMETSITSSGSVKDTPVKDTPVKDSPGEKKMNTLDAGVSYRSPSPRSSRQRYHTQPVETSNTKTEENGSTGSPVRRAKSFGTQGRHHTQPVTPSEKESADIDTPLRKSPGGSIADRLASLQKSGDEEWRKRISKSPSSSRESTPDKVVLRDKSRLAGRERPSSIADRLAGLQDSQKGWKDKVGEKDVKRFTVAGRLDITGKSTGNVDSPLSNRQKRTPKMPFTRESESSDGGSGSVPTSPTKPILGIRLPGLGSSLTTPKTPSPEQEHAPGTPGSKSADSSKENTPLNTPLSTPNLTVSDSDEEKDKEKPARVEVPRADDETFTKFFETTNNHANLEKVDVTVDDFNHVFIEANDILPSMKKLKPQRKQAGSRNPLRKLQARDDIQLEYTEVRTDVAEKELRRIKREQIAGAAHFASDALAGLASKENFSKVKLKKSNSSSGGAAPGELNKPFRDIMLMHVKGRRHCQTRLVEPSAKAINSGDCFLLVTTDKVFVWIGEFSNVIEKAKAAELGTIIAQKKDMGCKTTDEPITINELKGSSGGTKFWKALGGQESYRGPGPTDEDDLYESFMAESTMVFNVVGDELVPVEEYWGKVLKHEMLQPKMTYVFDFGAELYVWTGKQVPFEKRKKAMKLAREMWERGYDYSECDLNPITPLRTEADGGLPLKSTSRPDWAIFGKVNQNMETQLFKEKFIDWPDTSRLIKVRSSDDSEGKAELDLKPYDASLMVPLDTRPVSLVLEGSNLGRGNFWKENIEGLKREFEILKIGVDVWHVLEYEHFKLEEKSMGQFHDGDTYVIRWQYVISQTGLRGLRGQAARSSTTGRERCAYFFWQGKNSSITEQGASALMTVELDEERGPQIRVEQGKEPPAFTNLFDGAMITYIGKREEEETNTKGPWKLFVVGNELTNEVCLTEIPCGMQQLRSKGSFVLLNNKTGVTYVWQGTKSPTEKRTAALEAAQQILQNRPVEMCLHNNAIITINQVEEGEESREFYSAMGSKDRSLYHSLIDDKKRYNHSPRLFQMSSVSGVFEAKEILNPSRSTDHCSPLPFHQSELYKASQPGLFLLDNDREVYLWQGWWPEKTEDTDNVTTGSAKARFNVDRKCALETTLDYCKKKNADRPPKAIVVFAGVEPLKFTNLFNYWEKDNSVSELNKAEGHFENKTLSVEDMLEKLSCARYTFAELQERPLPDGVDPLILESYLHDDEFQEILGMSREEYHSMPKWKQVETKKDIPGLF